VLFSQAAVPAACRILMVLFRHPTAITACTNAAAAALSRPQKVTVMLPDCLLLGSVKQPRSERTPVTNSFRVESL
jgi:hypothetical protein